MDPHHGRRLTADLWLSGHSVGVGAGDGMQAYFLTSLAAKMHYINFLIIWQFVKNCKKKKKLWDRRKRRGRVNILSWRVGKILCYHT